MDIVWRNKAIRSSVMNMLSLILQCLLDIQKEAMSRQLIYDSRVQECGVGWGYKIEGPQHIHGTR